MDVTLENSCVKLVFIEHFFCFSWEWVSEREPVIQALGCMRLRGGGRMYMMELVICLLIMVSGLTLFG